MQHIRQNAVCRLLHMTALCLLCSGLSASVAGFTLPPRPAGAVADYAQVLDAATRQAISDIAQALWEQARFALVVVTFPDLSDEYIEDIATRLYEHWGIGEKGRDEGALLLLSIKPRDIRVETGYGTEAYLNDAAVGRILDTYIVPRLRHNDFNSAMAVASTAIADAVAREKRITLGAPDRRVPHGTPAAQPLSLPQLIIIGIVLALLLSTRFGRAMLFYLLLSSMLGGRRGHGGGFGGGFGGGGFGGGFGGGMSGGGGATRRF